MRISRSGYAGAAIVLAMALALGALWSASAQIPTKFTNLKVTPQDISQKELVDAMKSFTFALGTRCWFCHEGEGDDLSTYDFASDKNEHKETARRHIVMTREINEKFFKGREGHVTCNTCHRGENHPPE